MGVRNQLTAEDWCRAVLDQIALEGTASVSIEGLAKKLGVTKGSCYWHFKNRSALIAAAAEFWFQQTTEGVIEALAAIEDPAQRLRLLFDRSFGTKTPDASIAALGADPIVGELVQKVTKQRIAYMADLYKELGMAPDLAQLQATVTYATYVGLPALAPEVEMDDIIAQMGELTNLLSPSQAE